jgi:Carboxypeptidase regulatory-like domain
MMTTRSRGCFFTRIALNVAACLYTGHAQVATTGQVVGGVQDASAAAVSGAELRLENTATQIVQKTVTADDGGFVFPSVQPGVYKLTAVMKGFETAVYTNIVVNAARTTNQPITLKVGSVNEMVEVSGAAAALQLSTATISNTVEQKYLQDLPLPGREAHPSRFLPQVLSKASPPATARLRVCQAPPSTSL